MEISVVIPVYNEAQTIGETIRRIHECVPDAEVLVVDDGSTDNSGQVAREAEPTYGAIRTTLAMVLPSRPAFAWRPATRLCSWMVTGSTIRPIFHDWSKRPRNTTWSLERVMCGGHANHFRFTANQAYNLIARYATRFPVEDLTSGFRVMERETVIRYLYLLPNSFSYPTTLTLAYLRSGRTLCYLPIQAKKREEGKSKIKLFRDGSRFLLILIKIITFFSPLRIFLPVSLLFMTLGITNYAFTYFSAGRFTNMSALLLISSVIVFMIGLVSEQITQLRYDRIEKGG